MKKQNRVIRQKKEKTALNLTGFYRIISYFNKLNQNKKKKSIGIYDLCMNCFRTEYINSIGNSFFPLSSYNGNMSDKMGKRLVCFKF